MNKKDKLKLIEVVNLLMTEFSIIATLLVSALALSYGSHWLISVLFSVALVVAGVKLVRLFSFASELESMLQIEDEAEESPVAVTPRTAQTTKLAVESVVTSMNKNAVAPEISADLFPAQATALSPLVGAECLPETPFEDSMQATTDSAQAEPTHLYLERHSRKSNVDLASTAIITEDGFKVLAGSRIELIESENLPEAIRLRRENTSIKNGILQQDELFSSATAAAMFVLAQHSKNGPTIWKDKDGTTLKELDGAI